MLLHPFLTMNHRSLLPVSEEDRPVLNRINPLKRKRAQGDDAPNCNRCPDGSPERKRMRMTKDTDKTESAVRPSIPEGASSTIVQLRAPKRKNTALSSQSDARASENTLTETKRKEDHRVANIWIIGSSYIRRGEMEAREKFGENFGLNARVQWFGKGGMRWNGVLPRFYAELSTQNPPDILVVHAGGNDLGLVSAQELSRVMKKELMQLHSEFPSMKIVYSCINERQVWRYGSPGWINLDRKIVNSSMTKAADCFGGVVIEHPRLRYFDRTIFVPDGVHFTKKGNQLFLTNIQSVLKKILQSPQTT